MTSIFLQVYRSVRYKRKISLVKIGLLTLFLLFVVQLMRAQDQVNLSPQTAIVGNFDTWRLSIVAGRSIRVEDTIFVQLPRGWQSPQFTNPSGDAFTKVFSNNRTVEFGYASVKTAEVLDELPGPTSVAKVFPISGSIDPNDSVVIVLGDKSQGSRGLWPFYDPGIKHVFYRIERGRDRVSGMCAISINPRKAVKLSFAVPSKVKRGEEFEFKICALDEFTNVAIGFAGEVTLTSTDPAAKYLSSVNFTPSDSGVTIQRATLNSLGFHSLSARTATGITAISNPTLVESTFVNKIWWGDPHTHTVLSNHGYGTPRELFNYAKRVSQLDWVNYTEHDYISEQMFQECVAISNEFNIPGEFVTINGYEWSLGGPYGHLGIYFPTNDAPFLPSSQYTTPSQLRAPIIQHQGFAHVHHPFGQLPTGWGAFDSTFMRNVEMVNRNHTFEFFVQFDSLTIGRPISDALKDGLVFGFVGASDSHHSRPGMLNYSQKAGLTAVLAPVLTREAIFDALYMRRTYATTGAKIFLDFRVNNQLSGSILAMTEKQASGKSFRISVKVAGTDSLDYVSIVKNGMTFAEFQTTAKSLEVNLYDSSSTVLPVYYYARVRQRNGQMAWNSPIWLVPEGQKIPTDTQDFAVGTSTQLSIFPNPSRSAVTFSIRSKEHSNVTASVYGILGNKVADIAQNKPVEHFANLVWTGTNSRGELVANGTYFVVIRSGRDVLIKKFIFFR